LTSRLIGDVEAIQPFLNQGLIQSWMNVGQIVVILGYFFSKHPGLALLSLVLLPFQMLVQRMLSWRVKANARTLRDRLAGLAGATQEKLAATTIVKAFTRERDEVQRFTEDTDSLIDLGVRNAHLNGLSQASVAFLNTAAPLLILLVGGYFGLFGAHPLTIGLLVQFVMMQGQLYGPFERLSELQLTTANALGATDRIFDIFDTEPEVADAPGAVAAPRFRGEIRFEDVTFTYPGGDRPVLAPSPSWAHPAAANRRF
jgi:subfamily B ATP-binding cassette protein MsbA